MELDELNKTTLEYIKNHPFDPDAYLLYVMSDDWRPRWPFIYEEDKK